MIVGARHSAGEHCPADQPEVPQPRAPHLNQWSRRQQDVSPPPSSKGGGRI